MKKIVVFSGLLACATLVGCNAGLGALLGVLLSDDGGSSKKKRSADTLSAVELLAVENSRLSPARSVIVLRLLDSSSLPAELRVDFSTAGAVFAPATIAAPTGTTLASRGVLRKLKTSIEGVIHRISWNAVSDLGDDAYRQVTLRFSGDVEPLVVEVDVGNDAPQLDDVTFSQREGEEVAMGVLLSDSSSDPVDLGVEFAVLENADGSPILNVAQSLSGAQAIPSSPEGSVHAVTWGAPVDAGPFDRMALVRLTPFDRIGGVRGKTGAPIERVIALDNNRRPFVEILDGDLLTGPDDRGNIALRLLVRDGEGNPVDAIVQWAAEGESFPDLDVAISANAAARQAILQDPEVRRRLRIAEFVDAPLEGPVEQPLAASKLELNEVLASWLKRDGELRGLVGDCERGRCALEGREVTLVPADGSSVQTRIVCGYLGERGVLRLDSPFDPPASVGSLLRLDLGGSEAALRLASSDEGVLHQVAWNTSTALPGGGVFQFRITPFDRVATAAAGCKAAPGADEPGIAEGDRGDASHSGGAKTVHGPFLAESPVVARLAPIDEPVALAAVDVDSDGNKDLVVAARGSNAIVVLLQTRRGLFETLRLNDSRLLEPSGLVARDLDGDGDIDLAVAAEKTGRILLMYQQPGLDFFSDRVVLNARGALRSPTALTASDIDGDGDVDLAVAEAGGEQRGVRLFFRGAGPSSCEAEQAGYSSCFLNDPNGDIPQAITAAKVTQDSTVDIVTAGSGFFALYSLTLGQGNVTSRYLRVEAPGSDLRSVAVADIDNNGRQELLAPDRAGGAVRIASQTGGGPEFSLLAPLASGGLRGPVGIVQGDLDQNGVVDFAIADSGDPASSLGGGVCVFLGNARGEYSADSLELATTAGDADSPRAVAIADFDADGRPDIAAASAGTHQILIYSQGGRGSYRAPAEVIAPTQKVLAPGSLAVLDGNGDSKIDLIATNREADTLTIFEQAGSGTHAALRIPLPPVTTTGPEKKRGPVAAAAGDLNGDGRCDLVCANVDSNDLLALVQDQRGDYLATEIRAEGFLGPHAVALADIDGDGRIDIVAAARFSDEARWFRQEVDGEFIEGGALRATGEAGAPRIIGPVFVASNDMDGDGRVDIVLANHRSANMAIFLQAEERGSFQAPIEVPLGAGNRPVGVAMADFDGNGAPDLATANLGRSAVSIFLQGIEGSLELAEIQAPGGVQATSIAARDLNGDARQDLVVAYSGQSGSFLRAYFQDQDGKFGDDRSLTLTAPAIVAPVAVIIADLDGDGDAEIASANRQSRTVTVFYGGR